MTVALLIAAAALTPIMNCSASKEAVTTLAPTPVGEYITIMNNNAQDFKFDITINGNGLRLISAEDHGVFGKGSHQFSRFSDGLSSVYHSVEDPCALNQQPCGSSINLVKNANGTQSFIMETMWAVQIMPNPPGPKVIRPGLIVIHGDCKPAEKQK
ncbi:hypothetical protein [Novosphingobium sp.]|uniref:hypothetical protein n=1 Tax=Novosphingobium sp. TaxID=1874826 RepID=UPI003D09F188